MTTITAAEISSGVVSARSNLILIWKSTTYIGSHFYLEYYEVFDGTIVRKPFFTEEVYVGYSYINQNYTYNYTSTLNISDYQGKYFVCKLLDTNNSVITQTPRYYINPTPMTPSVLIRTITVPSTTSNYTIEVIPRDNNKIYCNTVDGSITEQVRNEQITLPLSNEEIDKFTPGYQYIYYLYSQNEYEKSDAIPLRIKVNTKPEFNMSLSPHIYRIPQEDASFSGGNGTDIINTTLVPNINSARSVYSIYRTLVFCDESGNEKVTPSPIELDPIENKSKNEDYSNTFYLQDYLKNESSNEIEYVKFKIKINDGVEYSDETETQLFAVTLKLKNIIGYDNDGFEDLYGKNKIYKQLRIAYDLDGSININSIEAKIGNNPISIHYTLSNNINWAQTDWIKDKQWASITIDDENFDAIYGKTINFTINYGNNYINNTYTISKTIINKIGNGNLTINNNNTIEIYNQKLTDIEITVTLNNFKEELKEGTNYFWNRVVSFSSNTSSNIIIQNETVDDGVNNEILTNNFNISKEDFLSWENNSNLYLVNNFETTFTLTVKYIHVLGYEYTIQETYTVSCKKQLTSGDVKIINYNYNNTGNNKTNLVIREGASFKVDVTSTLYSPDELTYTFSLDAYHKTDQTAIPFNLYKYEGSYSFSGSSSLDGSLVTIFNNEELNPLILEVEKQGWNVKYTFKLWSNTINNPIEKISEVIGTTYRHVEPMFTIERFKAEFGNTNDEIISEGTIKINTSNDFGFDTETSRQYTWTCSIQDINFNGQNKIVDFGNISNLQFTKVIEQGQTYYKCNFEISKEDSIFEYWKTSELIITLTAEVRTEFDSGNPVTTIKFNKPEKAIVISNILPTIAYRQNQLGINTNSISNPNAILEIKGISGESDGKNLILLGLPLTKAGSQIEINIDPGYLTFDIV